MAVYTFLEHYDFTGKVIHPFCTHEGSGLAGTVRDIEEAAPGAAVTKGLLFMAVLRTVPGPHWKNGYGRCVNMECEEIRVDLRQPTPESRVESQRCAPLLFQLNHTMPFSQDLTGKTVVPFMTNGGWPGHVIKDMKAACPGADFACEMQVRFDSNGGDHLETPESQITAWAKNVKELL